MFDNYSTREYQGAFGEPLVDVTLKMIYLPHPSFGVHKASNGAAIPTPTQTGWNFVYDVVEDAGGADYYPVSSDQAGVNPPY